MGGAGNQYYAYFVNQWLNAQQPDMITDDRLE